ncbi:MAG: TonB-dependent receptor [Staphylococcus sp.]|nr:TonB-dependent receptor [Staphylococcus sp.]
MKQVLILALTLTASTTFAQTEANTDTIATQTLGEVVVKSEKPQIKGQDGIMTVDLLAIVRDKPVTNILEALSYLPGVVDDNNGNIGLNGASSVTIIMNGEPTSMPLQNLYQLLYATPVDRLKNVEIMYSAPAKYHVNGAVINIVMKTPRPLDGLTGQVTSNYSQAHYASFSGGLNATYAIKDWSFGLNWSLAHNRTYNRQETFSNHLLNGTRQMVEDDMRQLGRNRSNVINTTIAYKKFKLSYNGQITSGIRNLSLSTGTFGDYTNSYKGLAPTSCHNIAVRYVAPFGLTVGGDYTYYFENRNQNLFKGDEEKVYSENRQDINRYHLYLDQEHPLGKVTVGYGVDYQHSDDDSRQSYLLPAGQGFANSLQEDVASAYISVQTSFDWGLSFNASAEAEYFHNDLRHNWNMIPQLGATYYRTPTSIFQLNFTSQRVYPSYWEMHGGTAYVNDYSTILGNPALQPYINYTGQLSYIFRQKYAATFYVLYADDYSVQLPYQSTDGFHLIFQTLNMKFSKTVGLQLHLPFDIGNIWNVTATANLSHAQQKSDHFHDLRFDNSRWGFYAGLNNTIRFTSTCPISLSVDGSYIAGQIQGPGRFDPLWKIDAGVKWQFGRKRCCELNLKANDIFNTCNPNLKIKFSSQDYRMKVHGMNRYLKLTFVYRFNGFKPSDNTIDTSRFGTGN